MSFCCVDDPETAKLFKALAHPMRLGILRALADNGRQCCGDLVCDLPVAQSTVSQHLKILKDAGLIRGDADGPRFNYSLDTNRIRALQTVIDGLLGDLVKPHSLPAKDVKQSA